MADASELPTAVQIHQESRCKCGHHPLEHDFKVRLLEGGPARCMNCSCADCELAVGSPPGFSLEYGR